MFKEVNVTQKKRPTKTPLTHEDLRESDIVENKTKFMFQNLGELRSVINVLNRQYGAGAARDVKVTLKLKNKMPSQHFKTKRDFLAQLKFALLKTPEKSKAKAE